MATRNNILLPQFVSLDSFTKRGVICWNARELETPMDLFVSSTAGKATRCSSARKNSLTGIGRMKLDESAKQYNSQR